MFLCIGINSTDIKTVQQTYQNISLDEFCNHKEVRTNINHKNIPGYKRDTGFSQVEIDHLLEIYAEVLPILAEHSTKWPAEKHTKESLK